MGEKVAKVCRWNSGIENFGPFQSLKFFQTSLANDTLEMITFKEEKKEDSSPAFYTEFECRSIFYSKSAILLHFPVDWTVKKRDDKIEWSSTWMA